MEKGGANLISLLSLVTMDESMIYLEQKGNHTKESIRNNKKAGHRRKDGN